MPNGSGASAGSLGRRAGNGLRRAGRGHAALGTVPAGLGTLPPGWARSRRAGRGPAGVSALSRVAFIPHATWAPHATRSSPAHVLGLNPTAPQATPPSGVEAPNHCGHLPPSGGGEMSTILAGGHFPPSGVGELNRRGYLPPIRRGVSIHDPCRTGTSRRAVSPRAHHSAPTSHSPPWELEAPNHRGSLLPS
jgi:hypothetical protein